MYVYQDSAVLGRTTGAMWEHVDISTTMLRQVFAKYAQVYIEVFNNYTQTKMVVPMDYYRPTLSADSRTIKEWLTANANVPLQTVKEFPDANMTQARYANAILHGYKIELARAGYAYPENMPVTELYDLQLTRPQFTTNLELIKTHCLTTVNGFFHRSDYASGKAYVLDGGKTAMKNRCSHTGILSFLNIGKVETIRIKEENIRPLTEGAPLSEGILIKCPVDITNKSVIMVIGGYMVHLQENVLFKNNDDSWVLNLMNLPYLERIQESEYSLDLSSMNIEHLDTNKDNAIVLASITSDAAIKAYLTLSQSFFAIVDTPALYFNKINVRVSNIPGLITAYDEPNYPVFMGYGKMVEYSKIKESDDWALRIADDWYVQFAWQTAPTRGMPVVTNCYKTWQPYHRSQAHFLEIIGKKK